MKVLVLGGNRYIGLHLVFELARQGHDVTVFNSHEAPMPEGTRRLHGDRRLPGVIEEVLTPVRDEFDAVFDNTSFTPEDMMPVVEMFRGRVRHFVFTSSIAVYNQSNAQPIAEDFPVSADEASSLFGSYGANKVLCEQILAGRADNGVPYTVVRVSHSCGPMSPLPTREPGTFTRLEQGRPLLLSGKVDAYIHPIHIQDVARLMCAILGKDAAIGQIYNAAGSQFCSIAGYMELMAQAVGVEPRIVRMPTDMKGFHSPVVHWLEARHGGMVFSIEKARRDLGWEPGFTLESALADSYRWFVEEGRPRYTIDFSPDEAILAELHARGIAV